MTSGDLELKFSDGKKKNKRDASWSTRFN